MEKHDYSIGFYSICQGCKLITSTGSGSHSPACHDCQDAWEGLGTDLRGTVARQVASKPRYIEVAEAVRPEAQALELHS